MCLVFQVDIEPLTIVAQQSARVEGKPSEKLTEATANKLSSYAYKHRICQQEGISDRHF